MLKKSNFSHKSVYITIKQDIKMKRDSFQNKILDLEKEYMNKIYNIVNSEEFKEDLLKIEKEAKTNYGDYSDKFNTTDKINIMAERIINHYIYMKLYQEIVGIFPSPVSSDIGIRMNDCILCIDAKTINVCTNKVDIKSTQIEQNQNSFNNKNYYGIKIKSNLKAVDYYHDKELPVLSYIVKIIYDDDRNSFKLNRSNEIPTVVVVCVPNGKLSNLFEYNIVQNFKTYDYYNETDNIIYKPIYYPKEYTNEELEKFIIEEAEKRNLHFIEAKLNSKKIYIEVASQIVWWQTSNNNKECLRAVKSGSNMRVYNEFLKERFDSSNEPWEGYREIFYE